jgi:hypothetical protein
VKNTEQEANPSKPKAHHRFDSEKIDLILLCNTLETKPSKKLMVALKLAINEYLYPFHLLIHWQYETFVDRI